MKGSNENSLSYNEIIKNVQTLFFEKGTPILTEVRHELLGEKIESTFVLQALEFHVERWRDLTRPSLMALACEAVGGDSKNIVQIAKALILISGAIDIHDDIIDQSLVKRSHPTLLAKFGINITLLTADALLFKGLTLMFKMIEQGIPPEKIMTVVRTIKRSLFELGDGEALELLFRGKIDVKLEDYLYVVRKKAADVEAYMRIGAILGGGSKKEINALGEFGRILGMMIILRDDLEDLLDFEGEMLHRVMKEVLPLPVFYSTQKSEIQTSIISIFKKEKILMEDAETIFQLTEKAGGLKYMRDLFIKFKEDSLALLKEVKYQKQLLKLIVEATVPPL